MQLYFQSELAINKYTFKCTYLILSLVKSPNGYLEGGKGKNCFPKQC